MNDLLGDVTVAMIRDHPVYPSQAPYHPSEAYPEWPGVTIGTEDNAAYRAVRAALRVHGLDAANYGTGAWDPLRDIVRPGDTVVLKPNFVSHRNLLHRVRGDTDCLITHGSVIRAALDYTAKAMQGRGTITIADCPIQSTNWDALLAVVGMPAILADARARFPSLQIEVVDCRLAVAVVRAGGAVDRHLRSIEGATEVEVGHRSLLVPITSVGVDFGVTHYGRERMRAAHTPTRHAYLIGNRFLECDAFINLPKLKAHQKAGITCALKNLVGINAHKDYLPHFRFGSQRQGGDEYPEGNWFWHAMWWMRHHEWQQDGGYAKRCWALTAGVMKLLLPYLAGIPRRSTSLGGGGWIGNDTLWRTVLDINRAFFYYDPTQQTIADHIVRPRYFTIVDGLIGGDHESPLFPSRVASGIIMVGANPAAIDATAAAAMGFDWRRIPQLRNAFRLESLPLASFQPEDIRIVGMDGVVSIDDLARADLPTYVPSFGYVTHIERMGRPHELVQETSSDEVDSDG